MKVIAFIRKGVALCGDSEIQNQFSLARLASVHGETAKFACGDLEVVMADLLKTVHTAALDAREAAKLRLFSPGF